MYTELASGQYFLYVGYTLFLILLAFEFLANAKAKKEIANLKQQVAFIQAEHSTAIQLCEKEKHLTEHWFNQAKILEEHVQHTKNSYSYKMETIELAHAQELKNAVASARADSNKRQRAVIRGQATEHLAPFISDDFAPKDYRFIGDPIDYLICAGSSAITDGNSDEIEKIVLMDIKTGNSQLNKVQRRIRNAVQQGLVEFQTYNPETKETKIWKNEK